VTLCATGLKARQMIEVGRAERAGLLATQGIRGGLNRAVLERIAGTGRISWAQLDGDWRGSLPGYLASTSPRSSAHLIRCPSGSKVKVG